MNKGEYGETGKEHIESVKDTVWSLSRFPRFYAYLISSGAVSRIAVRGLQRVLVKHYNRCDSLVTNI